MDRTSQTASNQNCLVTDMVRNQSSEKYNYVNIKGNGINKTEKRPFPDDESSNAKKMKVSHGKGTIGQNDQPKSGREFYVSNQVKVHKYSAQSRLNNLKNNLNNWANSSTGSVVSPTYNKHGGNIFSNIYDNKPMVSGRKIVSSKQSANSRIQRIRNNQINENIAVLQSNEQSAPNYIEKPEEMDWEYIPEAAILSDIKEIRSRIEIDPSHDQQVKLDKKSQIVLNNTMSKFYIVVDTNIFLSKLQYIKLLLDVNYIEGRFCHIIIPWMVWQELDGLKNRMKNGVDKNARTALRYLNEQLSSNHPHLKGQTAIQALEQMIDCTVADDHILNCCLQLAGKNNMVVLLSNDINLGNKALVNHILAYQCPEIFKKLRLNQTVKNEKICSQLETLTKTYYRTVNQFFDCAIRKEMNKLHNRDWVPSVTTNRSWGLLEKFQFIDQHWVEIFANIYPSTTKAALQKVINKFENCHQNQSDLLALIDSTIEICFILKEVSADYLKNAINLICELRHQSENLLPTNS